MVGTTFPIELNQDYQQGREDGYRAAESHFLAKLAEFLKEQRISIKNNRFWREHGTIMVGYTCTQKTLTRKEAQELIKEKTGEWVDIT